MMTGSTSERASRAAAILAGAVLVASLTSCAPEPEDIAGAPSKGEESQSESWSAENPAEVSEKKTELPASFPEDAFVIPKDAVIYDTGERENGSWFVVLSAEDLNAGDALWTQVISLGAFSASDVTPTENRGTFATLTNATLSVEAVMIPQGDDTVLLSYDITKL